MAKSDQYAFVDARIFKLGLNVNQIAIYTAVAAHRSKTTDTAYPSYALIGRMIGKHKDTVKREMRGLNYCNVWEVRTRRTKGGRNTSNLYKFNDPSVWRPLYGGTDAPVPEGTHAPTSGCTDAPIPGGAHAPACECTRAPRSHVVPGSNGGGYAPVTVSNKQSVTTFPDPLAEDDRYADPAEAGIPSSTPCKRKMADAGGDALKTTKASLSSNGHCNGSRNGNRKPSTDIEDEATAAVRNTARSKVSPRADEDDREPALSAFTRTTDALCDWLLEDG